MPSPDCKTQQSEAEKYLEKGGLAYEQNPLNMKRLQATINKQTQLYWIAESWKYNKRVLSGWYGHRHGVIIFIFLPRFSRTGFKTFNNENN